MLLPRSNKNAAYSLEVFTGEGAYSDRVDRVKLQVRDNDDDDMLAGLSLNEQETDDLIVMLTYYKKEVWGGS